MSHLRAILDGCYVQNKERENVRFRLPPSHPGASSWIIALIDCVAPTVGQRSSESPTLTSATPPRFHRARHGLAPLIPPPD